MATVILTLPDPMNDWVEAQTGTDRYINASAYVRDLIRRDQERAGKLMAVQRFIDEGEASGISTRSVDDIIVEARAIARARGLPD